MEFQEWEKCGDCVFWSTANQVLGLADTRLHVDRVIIGEKWGYRLTDPAKNLAGRVKLLYVKCRLQPMRHR